MLSERRRRWIVAFAAIIGMTATYRLGVWQLDRAAQKQALQDAMHDRGRLPALDLSGLARDAAHLDPQTYQPVRLQGRWLPGRTVFIDNRAMNGRPGFYVMTPLMLASGDAVVVQRGWAPVDLRDRNHLPDVPTPGGIVQVFGRVAPPPSKLLDVKGAVPGPLRQNLDLAAFSKEIGTPLRPLSVQQLDSPDAPADGLLRDWSLPDLNIERNHGYAVQWFGLCALIGGLFIWFQLIRPRRAKPSLPTAD